MSPNAERGEPVPSTDIAPGTARSEMDFREEVQRNLRRNFAAHLAHGLFGQTGFRLINAPTFIPAFVYALSGSDVAVGIARGLWCCSRSLVHPGVRQTVTCPASSVSRSLPL